SDYVGRIGIGRVHRGTIRTNTPLAIIKRDGTIRNVQIKQLFTFEGLDRVETDSVGHGDICALVGIEDIDISDTISDAMNPEKMPDIAVDEPTLSMTFRVNDSPFFGQDGKYVTSRHLRTRLFKEAEKDVALHVEELSGDSFKVKGRGVLHLSILIENMRREGYEMTISQPEVIMKTINGEKYEPIEVLTVDLPPEYSGKVIELCGSRKGEMFLMENHGSRQLLEFKIPTRGIIGIRSKLMNATNGQAIISHLFSEYGPHKGEIPTRINGVLVSMDKGKAAAYAIDGLQLRGTFFIDPNDMTYTGMIVGEHCKEGDLVVNLQREKKLTNMRASGSDRALKIAPAQKLTLEESLEYIANDELVEVTPKSVRMRKKILSELDRRRDKRSKSDSN
ncbi:MAG TPA: EF-Tu/IF-2/RF-3 family GTPase, partial [Victivallales bacterium]|nr:EF-Tu/IF-2/RF-3 family GTPase [Victivallales bacterium]